MKKQAKQGYYRQRFIGGPLDGHECMRFSHEGINDGFWSVDFITAHAVYEYKRLGAQFEDSDYILRSVSPRPSSYPAHYCSTIEQFTSSDQ